MDDNSNKDKRKRLNSHVEAFVPVPKLETSPEEPQTPIPQPDDPLNVLVDLLLKMNNNYHFTHDFLRLNSYNDIDTIKTKFLSLKEINIVVLDLSKYQNAIFLVMRSSNYDDIHKAMKYGIWTSTHDHNVEISEIYKQQKKNNGKVVLFFRVAAENVLCGVAELTSDYLEEQQFNFWWNKTQWKGIFNIRWIYVKNVDLNPIAPFEYDKRLYELTDGSKLSRDNGIFLLELFDQHEFRYEFSIFKFFQLFDQREDYLIGARATMDVKIKLQKLDRKHLHSNKPVQSKLRKGSYAQNQSSKNNEHNHHKDHKNNQGTELNKGEHNEKKRRASVPHKKTEHAEHKKEDKGGNKRKYSHYDSKGPKKHFVYVKKDDRENNETDGLKEHESKL